MEHTGQQSKIQAVNLYGIYKNEYTEYAGGARILAIQALQFDKKNEDAHTNCAMAWFIKNDIEKAKEHIQVARKLNPVNEESHNIEMQINFKEGKSLKEIIKALPEEMKNKTKTAHILADFNIKKEDYKRQKNRQIYFIHKPLKRILLCCPLMPT